MTDKTKIAEAMARYEWLPDDASLLTRDDVRVMDTLALAYFSEHVNDDKSTTREMCNAVREWGLDCVEWNEPTNTIRWYNDNWFIDITTIAKLRAACLLLGIETEGILDTKRNNT